jgi:coenzyme PQQ precursor peptide PqqA
MAWTTPILIEICIGLEINGYMPDSRISFLNRHDVFRLPV